MAGLGRLDRRLRGTRTTGKRPAYWYLRNGAREALNHLRTRRLAQANIAQPIVMGFVRRSGSTWVSQMLAEVQSVVTIGDPLLARNAWGPSKLAGFSLQDMYFTPNDIAPARPYLDRTLRLRTRTTTLGGWRALDLSLPVVPFVKIANAPWLLDWFADEFDAQTCLLVRHPIDIARSQLRHWNMPPHLDATVPHLRAVQALTPIQLNQIDHIRAKGTAFQKRLVEVVLEFRPIWDKAAQIHTLSYERLRRGDLDGFDFLDRCDPGWRDAMARRMAQRSKTTQTRNTLGTHDPHQIAEIDDLNRTLDIFDAHGILDRL